MFCLYADYNIPLLRNKDCALLDKVNDTDIFTKNEAVVINRYRHYKGVHCIGDMVYSDEQAIDPAMLTKHAGQSSRDFPHQYPSGLDHKLWRKVINSLIKTGKKFCQPLGRYILLFLTIQMYGL
jgi:hypothetical protein